MKTFSLRNNWDWFKRRYDVLTECPQIAHMSFDVAMSPTTVDDVTTYDEAVDVMRYVSDDVYPALVCYLNLVAAQPHSGLREVAPGTFAIGWGL